MFTQEAANREDTAHSGNYLSAPGNKWPLREHSWPALPPPPQEPLQLLWSKGLVSRVGPAPLLGGRVTSLS